MRKKLFILSVMMAAMLATLNVNAQGPTHTSGITIAGATGAESTDQHHEGTRSYKITAVVEDDPLTTTVDENINSKITITVDGITDWTTITKVTMWVYSSGSWGGQWELNSDVTAFQSSSYSSPAANTWGLVTYDFSAFPLTGAAWGQVGIQLWKPEEVVYLDQITFYNSAGTVLYVIDATDVAPAPTSITVTPNPIAAITGKSQQLSLAVVPADASTSASYASNDPSATVSGTGLVTTVSVGTAVITATSTLDGTVSGTTNVTTTAPDLTQTMVSANFEKGKGSNYDGRWGAVGTVAVAANPDKVAANMSDSVLSLTGTAWNTGFALKSINMNKFNKITFKAFTAATDVKLQYGVNGGINPSSTSSATLTASTWTTITYDVLFVEAVDKQFFIQLAAGTTVFIDDITYIAGDGSSFKPVTSIDITTTAIAVDKQTLTLAATIAPADATNKAIVWSLPYATATVGDTAILDPVAGTLKGVRNGSVKLRAVSADGGFNSEKVVTITNQSTPVTGITVSGAASATTITTDNGTLQMSAAVLPADATDNTVVWSVNDASLATIDATGLLTAARNGVVTVKATAHDGSTIFGTLDITITNQVITVSSITISSAGNATTITTLAGTLQLSAAVLPADAANNAVTWSTSEALLATVSATGLVTAVNNGTVTITATATDGSAVFGTKEIVITGQPVTIDVASVTVTGTGDVSTITTAAGTLQMVANVLPVDALIKSVRWSVDNASIATISATGLLTAVSNGTVVVKATSNAASGAIGTKSIVVSGQPIPVTSLTLSAAGNARSITTAGGTLQFTAAILPANATNASVNWSVSDTRLASISNTGLLTAIKDGSVKVIAKSVSTPAKADTIAIQISNQIVAVSIYSLATDGLFTIFTNNGTLQVSATVSPANAWPTNVTYEVSDTTIASISATGLVTALTNGSVTIIAKTVANPAITNSKVVEISNQVDSIQLVSLSDDGLFTIFTKGGTLQVSETVYPFSLVNDSVIWSVDDESLASVDENGLVTAIADGTVNVTATSVVDNAVEASVEIEITNQEEIIDAINNSFAKNFKLYPNPVKDELYITNSEAITYVEIIGINGKILMKKTNDGREKFTVNTNELASGVYIVKIHTENEVFGVKIVK